MSKTWLNSRKWFYVGITWYNHNKPPRNGNGLYIPTIYVYIYIDIDMVIWGMVYYCFWTSRIYRSQSRVFPSCLFSTCLAIPFRRPNKCRSSLDDPTRALSKSSWCNNQHAGYPKLCENSKQYRSLAAQNSSTAYCMPHCESHPPAHPLQAFARDQMEHFRIGFKQPPQTEAFGPQPSG